MITNLLPAEAKHTTLDLFEKQPLLITFDNSSNRVSKSPGGGGGVDPMYKDRV